MKIKLKLFLCLTVFTTSFFIWGQEYRYKIKQFNVDQGLAHTDATAIVQDDNGLIWIATYAGLNRFDGYNFRLFRSNVDQLIGTYSNRIVDLKFKDGLLFLATQGGLVCFNPSTESFVEITCLNNCELEGYKSSAIEVVGNQIYLLTSSGIKGFEYSYEKSILEIKPLTFSGSTPSNYNNLEVDGQQRIWLTSTSGLYLISDDKKLTAKKIQHIEVVNKEGQSVSDFSGIFADNDNQLWLGGLMDVYKVDLYSFNNNKIISEQFPEFKNEIKNGLELGDEEPRINSFSQTKNGSIWIGTNNGLIQFSDEDEFNNFVFYTDSKDLRREKLSTNRINHIFCDQEGNLWIGTFGGGVNFIDLNQLKFHLLSMNSTSQNGLLPAQFVRALVEDKDGNLWIGSEREGLAFYNFKTNSYKIFKHDENNPNTILDNSVRSLTFDSEGKLWVGHLEGISILDLEKGTAEHLIHEPNNPNSLSAPRIFSISEDKFGNIWAGSWLNGLNKIVRTESGFKIDHFFKESYSDSLGLTANVISYIYTDDVYPEIFVSTDEGLNQLLLDFEGNVDSIRHFVGSNKSTKTLSSNFIWPVERVNDSVLWVGTIGGGLNKVIFNTDGGDRDYIAENPLPSDIGITDVESLILDDQGTLWIGGNGLTQFDTNTGNYINYRVEDGLQGNSFKIGGGHKGKSGRFYFGGTQGITYFYPNEIFPDTTQANIVLTEFNINNSRIKVGDSINNYVPIPHNLNNLEKVILPYDDNNFALSFSSLAFGNPSSRKYRYKLDGFNDNWVELDGNIPVATFANLDHGDYLFQVNAANANGLWSNKIKSLPIEITPPWWATVLAKSIYLLIVLVLIYLGFRWVLLKRAYDISLLEKQQEENINKMRLQFFTNMSHEFRTPLTLIVNPLQELLKGDVGKRKRERYYSHMLHNSKRMLRLINELMDFQKIETKAYELQTEKNDIQYIVKEVYDSFYEFAMFRDIDLKFKYDDSIEPFWFDKTVLEKILYNVLGNSFKYTRSSGKVIIDVSKSNNQFLNPGKPFVKVGDIEQDQEYIWVSVSDTGQGIPADEIQFIFDRFFHKSGKLNNAIDGSGVGLSLVKSLAMLHQGVICVISEEDVGTYFTIGIPYLRSSEDNKNIIPNQVLLSKSSLSPLFDQPVFSQSVDHKYGKSTILIVEDNKELLNFIKENFEDEFNVLEGNNGIEALEILKTNQPDLIISDINMPKMDGIEFCERVKSSPDNENIPFILLTSNVSIEKQMEGAFAKADLFIAKPFSIDVLKMNIQNIIGNRRNVKKNILKNTFAEAHKFSEEAKDSDFMKRVLKVVLENLENVEFDVAELSKELNMSRTNVYNKVKSVTGKSTGSLIREVRVKKAAELLASEDISVSEAMYRVGIQSQSYFTKVFKQEFGKTPSQFVQEISSTKTE